MLTGHRNNDIQATYGRIDQTTHTRKYGQPQHNDAGKSSSHCTGSASMSYSPTSCNDASNDHGKCKMGRLWPPDLHSTLFVTGGTTDQLEKANKAQHKQKQLQQHMCQQYWRTHCGLMAKVPAAQEPLAPHQNHMCPIGIHFFTQRQIPFYKCNFVMPSPNRKAVDGLRDAGDNRLRPPKVGAQARGHCKTSLENG